MSYILKIKMICRGLLVNCLVRRTVINKIAGQLIGKEKVLSFETRLFSKLHFFNILNIEQAKDEAKLIDFDKSVVERYLGHTYNLLGTGWVRWENGTTVKGYLGNTVTPVINSGYNENDNERLGDTENRFIAWNVDVRTGYTFKKPFYDSRLVSSLPKGVEIKVPWELGRMYHWSYLALYSLNCSETAKKRIVIEFRSQMEDFMMHNPVGVGVQFYCAMEVAIRVINLLFSYDILSQIDKDLVLDKNFRERIERYMLLHAMVIRNNIEVNLNGEKNGNHYLSDLSGLIWIALYFKDNHTIKTVKPIFYSEICKQFFEDGSNFECSTAYHRLSSELSVIGIIALLVNNPNEEINKPILKRLVGMKRLLRNCTGIDGNLTQVGDNDSGRVFKLMPQFNESVENTLVTKDVEALIAGLFENELNTFSMPSLFGIKKLHRIDDTSNSDIINETIINCPIDYYELCFHKQTRIELPSEMFFDDAEIKCESTFGLIVIRGYRVDLFIRTGPFYNVMNLSHAHDDIFHFEICTVHGRFLPDCGSVSYTSSAEERTLFSSAIGHNVPVHKRKYLHSRDVFDVICIGNPRGTVFLSKNKIFVKYENEFYSHVRVISLNYNRVLVDDYSSESFYLNYLPNNRVSFGYGNMQTLTRETKFTLEEIDYDKEK